MAIHASTEPPKHVVATYPRLVTTKLQRETVLLENIIHGERVLVNLMTGNVYRNVEWEVVPYYGILTLQNIPD